MSDQFDERTGELLPWYKADFDGYDDVERPSRVRRSKKEHWMSRKSWRESSNAEAVELAKELAFVKEEIKMLKEKERQLKDNLLVNLKLGEWIHLIDKDKLRNDYIIEHTKIKSKRGLKLYTTLELIKKKFGYDVAAQIKEHCYFPRKVTETIYVRPFKKDRKVKKLDSASFEKNCEVKKIEIPPPEDDDVPF